jgi:hypothetical protein
MHRLAYALEPLKHTAAALPERPPDVGRELVLEAPRFDSRDRRRQHAPSGLRALESPWFTAAALAPPVDVGRHAEDRSQGTPRKRVSGGDHVGIHAGNPFTHLKLAQTWSPSSADVCTDLA